MHALLNEPPWTGLPTLLLAAALLGPVHAASGTGARNPSGTATQSDRPAAEALPERVAWETDLPQALALARELDRPLLIVFR